MAPCRRGRGADNMFYNTHNDRPLSADEAYILVRTPRARLPAGHPVGWDFEAPAAFEHELDGEDGIGTGMYDEVFGWDNEVPVDTDMRESSGSPVCSGEQPSRAATASAAGGTAGAGGRADASSRGATERGSDEAAGPSGGAGAVGAGVGRAVLAGPRSNIGVSLARSPQSSRGRGSAGGSDFRLMSTRMFVSEVVVVGEEAPEDIVNGSYDQLVGYVRGRLDRR